MALSPDELALFGPAFPIEDKPQISPSEHAAVLPPDAPKNDASLPPPAKATRKPKAPVIMSPCPGCGTDLNPENASRLRDGTYKHIGCPFPEGSKVAENLDLIGTGVKPTSIQIQDLTPLQTAIMSNVVGPLQYVPPHVIRIELGPETLAVLRALIK